MVLTREGGTVSRLALGRILGMVSVRLVGEALEGGLFSAAPLLRSSPLCVHFSVDRVSGVVLGPVLRQEDLRTGAVVIGRSTVAFLSTVGVVASSSAAVVAGDLGGVFTRSVETWGGMVIGPSLMGARVT